jgi:hypothetical protein
MPLAAILGFCLLSTWPRASVVVSISAMAARQSAPSQENQPDNSPQQGSAAPSPTDQPKTPEKKSAPSQSPASLPCTKNSQAGSSAKSGCKSAESAGGKTSTHHSTHKVTAPASSPAETNPAKTVVRNGGTADPTVDLSPGVSAQQASHQMESTNQLLATSDANLKKISGRQLNATQQDTVKQIKSYMEQAKAAASGGDVQHAYNLAVKANLLSAELVGH